MLQNASRARCVLILGNSRTEEMQGVLQNVQDAFPAVDLVSVSNLSELDAQALQPELVLICQNWPDEFSGQTLTELVRRFPVSRFLSCFSVWCEADGRTRKQWPVGIRVPARAADFRIRQEAEIIRGIAPAYPLTAGRDEIFQYQADAGLNASKESLTGKRIGVISTDPPYRSMLEALMLSWGAKIAVPSLLSQADLWLYDLDPWEVVQSRLMTQGEMPTCVGMMGLSHPETVTAARLLGVDAVVSKLAPEQELFAAVIRGLELTGTPQAEH